MELAPGESVHVYLAGHVEVETKDGRTASGAVTLRDLKMSVASKPAPAVRTVGDEQG